MARSQLSGSCAILGGTFSILHLGHEALLRAAAPSHHILLGLASDRYAKRRKIRPVAPYSVRQKNLSSLLSRMSLAPRTTIFELEDSFGPAIFDCGADTLVVSDETKNAAEPINRKRRDRGLAPLKVIVVPMVTAQDGLPISSTRISSGIIDPKGRRLQPLRVAVGSDNPSKLKGTRIAFQRAFPRLSIQLRGFRVPSGVHEQPVGFKKIWQGARNRAQAAARRWPSADYALGLESGLLPMGERHFDVQICALVDVGKRRITSGMSMGFPLPKKVESLVLGPNGSVRSSLGNAVDRLSGRKDVGRRKGALYYLSKGLLERSEMTGQAVLCAFVERRSPV